MSSISQFFENKSEIIIKNITKKVFCNHINEFTNIILYAPTEYKSIILNAKIKQLIPEIYEQSIVEMDELFFKSEYRKLYYYSSSTRERTYVTIFGELHFKRRYYVDKNKKNGFYLIDEILKLEKYKTYDSTVRGVLIQQSIITNPNQSAENYDVNLMNLQEFISDTSKTPKVPRQTIYEWIRDWNIPKVEYECFEKCKKLYVMVDEKWIHEQIRLLTLTEEEREKHHFIMSKCFVTFTGALTQNKRKELLNRHIFMTTEDKPWKLFMEEIYNIYNFEEIEEIYLLSDAGNWILAGKNELKLFKNNKVIVNTCEFHVKLYIRRFVKNKEKREELLKVIYEEKDKKKFKELADEIISNTSNKEKKEKYKNYILNHWKTILNMSDREIKSSMESHISHCIASHFGSRPKGYSKKRIEKYIKLQEYKENDINILDLYLKSYQNKKEEQYVYNPQNSFSFSGIEHNSSILPQKVSSNPIANMLHNIAYNMTL